ncbi:MAG: iron-containing alcohol dehydrogenase, partial [Erysipelotrichaceae bacterium]
MSQLIFVQDNSLEAIIKITNDLNCKKFLLVCDSSFKYLKIKDSFNELKIPYVTFNDFTSNPLYEDVCKGINVFNNENCDLIIAIGGGSTIDVAKCIKLYCKMEHNQ